MENFAYALENLFIEKVKIYKDLKDAFEKERTYIIDMDVDSLWKMTDRKNQIALEIEQIRLRIIALVQTNKVALDISVETFNCANIINRLPFSVKQKSNLKKINVTLNILKKDLANLASENKRYIDEHLSIVNGIFSTITGSKNREQYTYSGVLSEDKAANNLIRAEV